MKYYIVIILLLVSQLSYAVEPISFQEQLASKFIWDGISFKTFKQIEAKYTEEKNKERIDKFKKILTPPLPDFRVSEFISIPRKPIDDLYEYGLYLYEGYIFSHIELEIIKRKEKDFVEPVKLKHIFIYEHINDTSLRVRISDFIIWHGNQKIYSNNAVLILDKNHPALKMPDKKVTKLYVEKIDNTFEYETVLGVKKIVDCFVEVEKPIVPDLISNQDYIRFAYNKGLSEDFWKKMIIPDKSCKKCEGKGYIDCGICEKGKLKYTVDKRTYSILCPVGCHKGKRCCPECVLIDKPNYKDSSEEIYKERLRKFKERCL